MRVMMKLNSRDIKRGLIKAVFVGLAIAGGFALAMTYEIKEPVQANIGGAQTGLIQTV